MRILFLLAKQFRQICLTKKMSQEGLSQTEIASKLGVPSFVVRNLASCARSYTVEELENAVRDFVDAEEAVKTGTLGDVLSVELLIVKYSSARAVRARVLRRRVLPQGRSVVPEPFFAGFILRHHRCHHCIKGRGMIHFFSVGKFVYYNIIQDFFRGEDQPPVEVQVSFAGAASPAGFLFPDRDTAVGYAHFSGVGCGFSFEYFSGGFHIITAAEFRKRRVFSLGLCRLSGSV